MATIYFKADASVLTKINNAVKYHPDLMKARIRIGVLFALSGKEDQPALKEAGNPVDGIIKIVPLKDRVFKDFDVEVILDGDSWKLKNEQYQMAFLDHLLSRLELKKPKTKTKKTKTNDDGSDDVDDSSEEEAEIEYMQDDIGRPVLKMRKWDWNAGFGFKDVVRRHGQYAPECYSVTHAKGIIDSAINDK